jgi:8-oxo-dGTP diphosphatase
MKMRAMAGILLSCGDALLMIRRNAGRELAPNLWAIPGGHIEPEEINDPEAACLRELFEETGYLPEDISGLFLRYIVFWQTPQELQVFYDFTAKCAQKKPLPQNGEGDLHWINKNELPALEMPPSMGLLFDHYLANPAKPETLVGVVRQSNIHWQRL